MANSFVQVPPDSTGKRVDAASLTSGAVAVQRQRMVIADNAASAEFATVSGGALLVTGTMNVSAMPAITGTVNLSGTAQVAISTPFTVNNISATVTVAGAVTIASTLNVAVATPFTINNISATVAIAGTVNVSATASVILAAGTANFGTLNDISRTVQVAIGTNLTLQGISTTVQVAVATPFTLNNISATVLVAGAVSLAAGTIINNISATVTVAGNVNISATPSVVLAAGTANFGTLNDISRTVQVAVGTPFTVNNISATVVARATRGPIAIMSASHGPKNIVASTSANVTLIASPGAGLFVYVTQLMVGNASATLTKARIGTSASIGTINQPLAANGGGFVMQFDPPWKLSASEAALCSVKPNVSEVFFTVHYYVEA